MMLLDKLVLKQDVDNKLIINVITCSILESLYTSDYAEMENGVFKLTCLELTIKHLTKETILCHRAERNLVRRGIIWDHKFPKWKK